MQQRILLLTQRTPHPPDRGDRIRAYHLLKFLSRRARVSLACLADEPVSPASLSELQGLCERVAIAPLSDVWRWPMAAASLAMGLTATEGAYWSRQLASTIGQWDREHGFDSVIVYCSSMAPYLARLESMRRTVVDLVDVDSEKWSQLAEKSNWPRSLLYHVEAVRLRRLEQRLARKADVVTLVSDAETKLFQKIAPDARSQAILNGVDLDYFGACGPLKSEAPTCTFVGVLDYPPNVDAIEWFVEHVWPGVRSASPEAVFRIVGRRPCDAVLKLRAVEGVEVHADVPDVRDHLVVASCVVAPLRVARGIQNKVLEAMAANRPVVVSKEAHSGIAAAPNSDLIVADSPEEWRRNVVRLLQDADFRSHIAANGRRFVEQHHNWETCLAPFEAAVSLTSGA